MDPDDLASLTVAIELDNDIGIGEDDYSDSYNEATTSGVERLALEICIPPSASSLVPHLEFGIKVRDLKGDAKRLIQLRLDPIPLGSMRNWEFIANQMGLDNDRIINLQRCDSPTEQLLKMFGGYPLAHLLSSIADSNRIDLLISLQPYLAGIRPGRAEAPCPAHFYPPHFAPFDPGLINMSTTSFPVGQEFPIEPFIVVTHCSPKKTPEYKNFKWFFDNLKISASNYETISGVFVEVVNIDKFLNANDDITDLEKLFRKAKVIVVVCSTAYKQMMENPEPPRNHLDKLKKHFHTKFLDVEYVEKGRNERFRPVIIKGTQASEVLLNGWQKNTIVHEFPSKMQELAERIFSPKYLTIKSSP
ncbi:hypothetical protein L596_027909 [Steinernema carpocapsae]|uniref:SEFIR domain-containing protein n=1 Tax=Steinernema carpocapsae TaxID=34508 RepID=A0A4U5LWW5_STECR|nr:hypothetical protein L596_027909 [Steinernema carpocapsae]